MRPNPGFRARPDRHLAAGAEVVVLDQPRAWNSFVAGHPAGTPYHRYEWLELMRRSLFTPLPAGTILDDVLIPMGIVLRGHRVVFEERALAYDHTAPVEQEFRRKVRTLAGNYQLFRLLPGLWSPRRNRVLFEFVSHKVSRLLAPFALLALFASGAVLAFSGPVYGGAFVLQVLCYGLAGMGWAARHRAVRSRFTTVPLTFVMLNSAALLGLIEFVRLERGAGRDLWVRHEAPDLGADGQRAA